MVLCQRKERMESETIDDSPRWQKKSARLLWPREYQLFACFLQLLGAGYRVGSRAAGEECIGKGSNGCNWPTAETRPLPVGSIHCWLLLFARSHHVVLT